MQALAADGRCKTFDATADGYGQGEGCGIVVLKRLSHAERDGDQIMAIIRGSALNHNGPSSGLTVPNEKAEAAVIKQALKKARIKPQQISYVEAHGTGTSLGDPIEMAAMQAVFGESRQPQQPLLTGSVKTNIGHLEAAAGIACFIKVVLAMQHQKIPPHLHFNQPNPHIPWQEMAITVNTELTDWPAIDQRRIAGINSFGISGTNAHIVIEQGPINSTRSETIESAARFLPLTLSAHSAKALNRMARRYQQWLSQHQEEGLDAIVYNASLYRQHFDHRLCILAKDQPHLIENLAAFSAGKIPDGVFYHHNEAKQSRKICFLFTGQGAQYQGMGYGLYQQYPLVKQLLDECDTITRDWLQRPLLDILFDKDDPAIHQTEYTQPALFALEYALARLWQSWGIQPDMVMGHSVGEYVAACIAGVFSLADGLKLIIQRARLMQALPENGAMMAVKMDQQALADVLQPYAGQVSIASINGISHLVISGRKEALTEIENKLQSQHIQAKRLAVSHAFHSPLMEPMLAPFMQQAEQIAFHSPQIEIVSNLTGRSVYQEITTAQYWVDHIRQPVLFVDSIQFATKEGINLFLEIGSKPVLTAMAKQCFEVENVAWAYSLRPEKKDGQVLLENLALMYCQGVTIDWSGVHPQQKPKLSLPTYAWDRKPYWPEQAGTHAPKLNQQDQSVAGLLAQGNVQALMQKLEQAGQLQDIDRQTMSTAIECLMQCQQAEKNTAANSSWFYDVSWQPMSVHDQTVPDFSGESWIILADETELSDHISALMGLNNGHCFQVYKQPSSNPNAWIVDPDNPESYRQLFQHVAEKTSRPIKGIVNLWGTSSCLSEAGVAHLKSQQCLNHLLILSQTLVTLTQPPRLYTITQNTAPLVSRAQLSLFPSLLWGFCKVFMLESPQCWGRLIDISTLSESSVQQAASHILVQLKATHDEDFISYENAQCYVPRLHQQTITDLAPVSPTQGTVLITGGTGNIGMALTQWLVAKGMKNILLIARHKPSDAVQSKIAKLNQGDVKIQFQQRDITQENDVAALFKPHDKMLEITGIIHAAGVAQQQTITDMSIDSMTEILAPKVMGSWLLHTHSQSQKLDFFICLSSIASIWGSRFYAHYAAANHFLDQLAHCRQQQGLPALTLNWGPWLKADQENGMVSDALKAQLEKTGISAFNKNEALQALESIFHTPQPQMTIANIHWPVFLETYQIAKTHPMMANLVIQPLETELDMTVNPVVEQLATLSEHARFAGLMTHVQNVVMKIMQLEAEDTPNPTIGFFDMGFDSLMAVEFKSQLSKDFATSLPTSLAFDYPNINAVCQYLSEQILQWTTTELTTQNQDNKALVSEVEQLAESELEAMINNELDLLME